MATPFLAPPGLMAERAPWLGPPPRRALHLTALWAFGAVQPLFDLLGRNAEFFVARGNGSTDILIFAFAFTLIPPLLMAALEGLAGAVSRRAAAALHLTFVALLAAAIVLGALNESSAPAAVLFAVAIMAGALAAAAYRAHEAVRTLATLLAPAPAIFLIVFLVFSEVGDLIRPAGPSEGLATEAAGKAPIVLIVLDELPAATLMRADGTLDARHFPGFARLARTSTWYRRATTVADRTSEAVPAIFTGREPDDEVAPTAAEHPESIFTAFAGSRQVNVWESATRLCPSSACDSSRDSLGTRLRALASDLTLASEHLLLPSDVSAALPPVDETFSGFGAGGAARAVDLDEQRLDGLIEAAAGRSGEPSLNVIHLSVPHLPWYLLPDGRRCQAETWLATDLIGRGGVWLRDPAAVRAAHAAHILQAGYADRLLGRAIGGLRKRGVWDRAVAVVVADHGVSFTPGGIRRTVTPANAGATLRVPMFVKLPGQRRGEVSGRLARTVDVLPTIAAAVGARLPFATDGEPAGQAPARGPVTAFAQDPGVSVTATSAEVEAARASLSRSAQRLLGPGRSFARLFRRGPAPELLGEPVPPARTARQGSYRLVAPEAYADVELAAEVPCQLAARLEGVAAGEPLAVVVNGKVAATTGAYRAQSGAVQAFALVAPAAFREGANEVSLWRIEAGARSGDDLVALTAD